MVIVFSHPALPTCYLLTTVFRFLHFPKCSCVTCPQKGPLRACARARAFVCVILSACVGRSSESVAEANAKRKSCSPDSPNPHPSIFCPSGRPCPLLAARCSPLAARFVNGRTDWRKEARSQGWKPTAVHFAALLCSLTRTDVTTARKKRNRTLQSSPRVLAKFSQLRRITCVDLYASRRSAWGSASQILRQILWWRF